jgi:hypothetical protein
MMSLPWPRRTLLIAAAVLAWALHALVVLYLAPAACAHGLRGWVPWGVGAATVLAAGTTLVIMVRGWRVDEGDWLSSTVATFALAAIVAIALPALMVSPCLRG